MSMFDYYRPIETLRCPACGRVLEKWQGKDGPNALFVWQEGEALPVAQEVDAELELPSAELARFSLPATFRIYCYDCPIHQPIEAVGNCKAGIWRETRLLGLAS